MEIKITILQNKKDSLTSPTITYDKRIVTQNVCTTSINKSNWDPSNPLNKNHGGFLYVELGLTFFFLGQPSDDFESSENRTGMRDVSEAGSM